MMRLWPVVGVNVILCLPSDTSNDGCFEIGVEHEVVEVLPWDPGKAVALCVEEVDLMDGQEDLACVVAALIVVLVFA